MSEAISNYSNSDSVSSDVSIDTPEIEMRECPNHGGAFDCTPFCFICEGEQEYHYIGTLPCKDCSKEIDDDIWREELGMCIDCSNKYWSQD